MQIKYFVPYPDCQTSHPGAPPFSYSFANFYGDESFIPNPFPVSFTNFCLTWEQNMPPIYDGVAETGEMTLEVAQQLKKCGFTADFDFLSEEKVKATIWSFAENR